MKRLLPYIIAAFLIVMPLAAYAGDIVVIVNADAPIDRISKKDLIDIFMGKNHSFADGTIALPLDQQVDSEVREKFYENLIHKTVAQVNAYWAKLLFTGRATPPKLVTDSSMVLQLVQKNHDAIGYIHSDELDDSVKEVFRVN